MYKATLEITDKRLIEALRAEDEFKKDRSSLRLGNGKVYIEASDITAFKATLHGIIKLIETYEKAAEVK